MNIAWAPDELASGRGCAFVVRIILLIVACLLLAGSPARAFEVTEMPAEEAAVKAALSSSSSSALADPCLYLLKSIREQNESAAVDRQYRNAAGSAAAVGLVFGVRFALGPQETMKVRRRQSPAVAFHVWETRDSVGGGQALAIADYRACRNEQALRALTD